MVVQDANHDDLAGLAVLVFFSALAAGPVPRRVELGRPQCVDVQQRSRVGPLVAAMRLALAATAPVPSEVARCFHDVGNYGRDLIATGPYMIAGEDRIDPTSCARLRPIPGFRSVRWSTSRSAS